MARATQVAAGGWQGQRGVDWLGREALRLPQGRCLHQDGRRGSIEARHDRGALCPGAAGLDLCGMHIGTAVRTLQGKQRNPKGLNFKWRWSFQKYEAH